MNILTWVMKMQSEVLIIKDDLYQFNDKKTKIPSDMLVIKDDLYVFDECNDRINNDAAAKPEKNYLIECPFESVKDNEISLDTCRGCYWNNGVINNLEGVPVKVKCVYGFHNNYVVQVFSDYHAE